MSHQPVWCPEQQIYIGGVPGATNQQVDNLLKENEGYLYVFGYGSLCWNPGTDGALGHSSVVASPGHAKGYRRCWAQKSTDHRGFVSFPGIVCTLLQTSEVEAILKASSSGKQPSSNAAPTISQTEGMIYKVPPALARTCLDELDFREKGGYAREIIEVIEDATCKTIRALLYRGTPDNPAFWPRVVGDLPLAAAVMAVSIGPSGPNDVYLNQLNDFLLQQQQHAGGEQAGQDDTCRLAQMTKQLQQHTLYFLYGCGSNQHGQIHNNNNANSARDEDVPLLAESVLWCQKDEEGKQAVDPPQQLFAGGGHSGLLTQGGQLYLWGWNEQGQCGPTQMGQDQDAPFPLMQPLSISVENASLGFSHTLLIEKGTQRLYGMGDNSHGQVLPGDKDDNKSIATPTPIYPEEQFLAVAAGVFHSAAITTKGALLTWGGSSHGQSLPDGTRWKPTDGSSLIHVVCGRHHTAVLDDQGRVWTFGDNKYGQLGRDVEESDANKKKKPVDPVPRLVNGPWSTNDEGRVVELQSGWSHVVVRVESSQSATGSTQIYGWGRSDKGQLGCQEKTVTSPRLIEDPLLQTVSQISCGSESTYFLDASQSAIYSCGWNEHRNLGVDGSEEDVHKVAPLVDTARIVSPPTYSVGEDRQLIMAAGGAHFLVLTT